MVPSGGWDSCLKRQYGYTVQKFLIQLPFPAQRRWEQRIPVPIQPCLAVGTISINNNNKKRAASMDFDVRLGQGSDLNLEHLKGWGRLSIAWYPWMAFLERTWKPSRSS